MLKGGGLKKNLTYVPNNYLKVDFFIVLQKKMKVNPQNQRSNYIESVKMYNLNLYNDLDFWVSKTTIQWAIITNKKICKMHIFQTFNLKSIVIK